MIPSAFRMQDDRSFFPMVPTRHPGDSGNSAAGGFSKNVSEKRSGGAKQIIACLIGWFPSPQLHRLSTDEFILNIMQWF